MVTYHIINGDALANELLNTQINLNHIVFRECLIEGNLYAENLDDFWKMRAKFIATNYTISNEEYFNKTVKEFEKIYSIRDTSNVCLWFENDLFCQTNMWFIIAIISRYPRFKLFRVFPIIENEDERWKGFRNANSENLEQAYYSKIEFTPDDIELGNNLWLAYQNNDLDKLKKLSKSQSNCFSYLEEVCQAHIDRFPIHTSLGRPEKLVKEIMETKSNVFEVVFTEFTKREEIYGFGDLQIKTIYEKLIGN